MIDISELQSRLLGGYLNCPETVSASPFAGRMGEAFTGKWASLGRHIDALLAKNATPSMEAVLQLVIANPENLDPAVVMDLPGAKAESTIRGYERQMQEWTAQRKIMTALRAAAMAIDPEKRIVDPAPAVASLMEQLRGVDSNSGADVNAGKALKEAIERSELARANAHLPPVSWGVPCLDSLCPLETGRMYILAAAPKCGKTSLAMQAAMATAKTGAKVALASLEMRADELAQVMACRELGFDARAFRKGQLDPVLMGDVRGMAEEWDRQDNIIIRDTRGEHNRCSDIASWIKVRHRMAGLGLVIIDYLQLMASSDSRKSEYEVVTANTRTLKLLASSLNVPIIVLSQMNRDGRKQTMDDGRAVGQVEPTLNALRSSGSIEQDADAVLFLWSERTPDPGETHRQVQAKLACSRFCDTGKRDLMFYGPQQLFSDAASPTAPPPTRKHHSKSPHPGEDLFHTEG